MGEVQRSMVFHIPEEQDKKLNIIMCALDWRYEDRRVNIATLAKLGLALLVDAYEEDPARVLEKFGTVQPSEAG